MFSSPLRPSAARSYRRLLRLTEELRARILASTDLNLRTDVQNNLLVLYKVLNELGEYIEEIEKSLNALTAFRLTEKQRRILRLLSQSQHKGLVYTQAINVVSKEFRIPESTARWNLRILRESALLEAGNCQNKGIPLRITEAGRIALKTPPPEELTTTHLSVAYSQDET